MDFSPDFIIGIGGGSPIDAAKAASVLIFHKSTDTDLLFDNRGDTHITLFFVPTTAGSGSESTPSSILTVHTRKTKLSIKRRVYCEKAFINFRYTISMPYNITVSTAVDVLTHLVDEYMSAKSNIFVDKLVKIGLLGFSEILPMIQNEEFNECFREKIMILSSIAGIIIANTRTTLTHTMSYPLTYGKKITHGFACGLLAYEYLVFHKNKYKVDDIVSALGFANIVELKNFLKNSCPNIVCSEKEIYEYSNIVFEDKERLSMHPYEVSLIVL